MGGEFASRAGDAVWLDVEVPRRPTSVTEALAALEAVTARLFEAGDQRAAFPDIYAIITRRVAESVALGRGAFFLEPQWISRLAGRFCERYLETLRWSLRSEPQDTGAWSVAYACCEIGDMLPVNHVMLGLSAHINYDLALGLAANIAELGGGDDATMLARYKHDHDAVNHLLRASVPEAFDHLVTKHRCPASRMLYRRAYAAAEWLAMMMLTTWRERVWGDAMDLLQAQTPVERNAILSRIERRSRQHAKVLAAPGIVPLSSGALPVAAPRTVTARGAGRTERFLDALA
jgi:hypothetical protein